jgi:hypothetical protein
MRYEVVKIKSDTEITVLPATWFLRKNAEQAAEDANKAEPDRNWAEALTGVPRAKWTAMHYRTVDALFKQARKDVDAAVEAEKPAPQYVVEDAA